MSRRGFVKVAAGTLVGGMAGGTLLGPGRASAAVLGAPLIREPEILRSSHGLLDVTLRAEPATIMIGGQPRQMLTYNGTVPGPTLMAHPGDTIRVRLVNALDDDTNLHTHGLHISGEGNADNVMIHVKPGEEFQYEYELPADHHTGTNWYHPHAHGTAAPQLFAGMAGGLVVSGRAEDAPGLARMRERTILLHAIQFNEDGTVVPAVTTDQRKHRWLVNGELDPVIDIAPGEVQRWRLINSGVNSVLQLKLDGQKLVRIAADGNPFKTPVELDTMVLAAGQRADVIVRGGAPGTTALRTVPYDLGAGFLLPEARLARLESGGAPATGREPNLKPLLRPFVDLRRQPVDVRREIAMTMAGGFGIDGRPFDPDRVDQVCELGAVEEWTVRNPSPLVHPFHIHVNPFQVTHVDGQPVDSPSYEDTVVVRPNGGSVTFRTRFEDFLGTAVFHCHFVTHSELGMMGVAEVVPAARGQAVAVASSGLDPITGLCHL